MAIIRCKMCGGDVDISADKTFGTCECCGNTMTFPKVDDDQRAAAFNRGNHFRRIGEFDKALAVYERIVREDDTDAEAHWCCALCRFGIEYVEDPATYEWLPTCHRASFDSFLEDVDYLAAVEHSDGITRRQYQKDAAKIAEVQRGILATSQNEDPFDVFICYKESDENGERTRDSLMAQDVYYQLTDQGYRVFFARITLEDMVGKQYEPYIFAALNSAKVMIVIGTKPEYMNAVWVKNEWSRFLAMMKKDRNKLLLPCYRDMDPYDMPEQLSVLQSYDMTKIGFIQDLIRGIKKVLDADKKAEIVHETVVAQQTSSNTVALLKRGNMALEDGEWDKADHFFEEVLNQDAECAEAYIGSFLAGVHASNIGQFIETQMARMCGNVRLETRAVTEEENIRKQWVDQAAERYQTTGILSITQISSLYPKCATYTSERAYWKEQKKIAADYLRVQRNLQCALNFSDTQSKIILQGQFAAWEKAIDERISQAIENDNQQERAIIQASYQLVEDANEQLFVLAQRSEAFKEEDYKQLCIKQTSTRDQWGLRSLRSAFERLGDYKDCHERALWCQNRIAELKRQESERQQKIEQIERWMDMGKCAYCGGEFTGLFTKKCSKCGELKSY